MTPLDPAAAAEANRLYWDTEDSVSEIAERLEISRRALYDAVEPFLTGSACDVCGGPLAFENRSARTAGETFCAICAETGATDSDEEPATPAVDDDTERALLVGGVAVAGAAIGALIAFALVPRK
jgi:uncharacterized Zn finger protein (UPF0148 family)